MKLVTSTRNNLNVCDDLHHFHDVGIPSSVNVFLFITIRSFLLFQFYCFGLKRCFFSVIKVTQLYYVSPQFNLLSPSRQAEELNAFFCVSFFNSCQCISSVPLNRPRFHSEYIDTTRKIYLLNVLFGTFCLVEHRGIFLV